MGLPKHLLDELTPENRARVLEGQKRHQEKIQRAVLERRWLDVLMLHDRNKGPELVYGWWEAGVLTTDDLRTLLPEAWVGAEYPVRDLGERKWLRLFREVGYVYRWSGDARWKGSVDAPPSSPVTVHRGAPAWTQGRGMSWAVEMESAEWFADRWASWGVPAAIYRATVPAKAVLGMFNDRREQEVVINPNMLRGRVELVRTVAAVASIEHPIFGTVSFK